MKARKTTSHRSLIDEVISQTSLRFTPQTHDIKKVCSFFFVVEGIGWLISLCWTQAIDILIQTGYIERAHNMWDSYVYVP
jgi:hypothetical protein